MHVLAGAVAAARNPEVADALAGPFVRLWEDTGRLAPSLTHHPRVTFAVVAAAGLAGVSYYWRCVAISLGGTLCTGI